LNGKQVFPAEAIQNTHASLAQFANGGAPFNGAGAYGLGWNINTYRGEKVVYHFGGFPGFRSHISFMPEKKLGVAIFVNEGGIGAAAADILAAYIYDWAAAVPDHSNMYTKKLDDLQASHEKAIESMQRTYADRAKRVSQLTLPLGSYVGKYRNEYFGEIEVNTQGDALSVTMGNMHVVSTPFTQKETIRVELIPGAGQVIGFKMDDSKKVNTLVYDGIEYKKVL
jgi:CubicO group peptidase (beta-lactamase class C family)